ncbi:hypothetical protein [Streptomyces sp. YIM S03343]
MIYRHHIAPPRAYTQFSHDIIRHPRLSSDAVRLLTWQLSLPQGAREPLSRSAQRARIGGSAFTRAKRQLKNEGFVHERRLQGPGGHWVTQQLVSSVPLSPGEAAKLLARMPVGPVDMADEPAPVRVSPQLAPSGHNPTAGDPTPPLSDGHPMQDLSGNTSHQPPNPPQRTDDPPHPAHPEPEPKPEPETTHPRPLLDQAAALVSAFPHLSPDLRHIPRPMHAELTRLTADWLAAGHPPTSIRTHILRGLPDNGTPVHHPGGLLRHLLRDVPPAPEPDPEPASTPPSAPPPGGRLSARLTGTRECEGHHDQATLFRPTGEEVLCPECTARTALPV